VVSDGFNTFLRIWNGQRHGSKIDVIFFNVGGIGEDTYNVKSNIDDLIPHIMEANDPATNTDVTQIPATLYSVLSNIFKEV
jgi:hypothetical protein